VGQTVDDAKKWADDLIKKTDDINNDIQKVIDQMDKLGKAKNPEKVIKNYCKCDAKFDGTKKSGPICVTGCDYSQQLVPIYDPVTKAQIGSQWVCGCAFKPCQGSPCEQMTDYLSDLWNNVRKLKIDFTDFYTYMVAEPRSDIMKELAYSRKATNSCSLTTTAYGLSARLLDCTRVQDEIIDPNNSDKIKINGKPASGYCYGINMGKLSGKSLTDNWFCCEEQVSTTPTARQGQ
jgi:hypothetical protein